MEQRTLRLDRDAPGFEYQYEVCVTKFLGMCTKTEMRKETWDLKDPATRTMLIDKGFVLRVREDITP